MHSPRQLLRGLPCLVFAVSPCLATQLVIGNPVDVVGTVAPGLFASRGYAAIQSYKDWGNEPFIAVNPVNSNQMVISSFSYGTSSMSAGADIFYSVNGGSSWTPYSSVPAPQNGVGIPDDWTFAYDSTGRLHATVLGGCDSNCNIYHGSTTDPTNIAAWSWTGGGTKINNAASTNLADQPWMSVSGNRVFAAYDAFGGIGADIRMATSTDGGATFTRDTSMVNGYQSIGSNPGTRITTNAAGDVYSVYTLGSVINANGVQNVTYYINRSRDGGATWDFLGSSAAGGIIVGSGVSDQVNNGGTQSSNNYFGNVNDMRGSYTAIASDPAGQHLYVVWGKRDGTGIDRLYLTEYHPVGGTLVAGTTTAFSVPGLWAALPSLTVLADGTVVVMYDVYDPSDNTVHVHIASSSNFGASFATDVDVYWFQQLSFSAVFGNDTFANREYGDYQYITSLGNTFYGTFVARGNNAGVNDTSTLIDPFFFSGSSIEAVPEPATWTVLATGLALLLRRRRAKP